MRFFPSKIVIFIVATFLLVVGTTTASSITATPWLWKDKVHNTQCWAWFPQYHIEVQSEENVAVQSMTFSFSKPVEVWTTQLHKTSNWYALIDYAFWDTDPKKTTTTFSTPWVTLKAGVKEKFILTMHHNCIKQNNEIFDISLSSIQTDTVSIKPSKNKHTVSMSQIKENFQEDLSIASIYADQKKQEVTANVCFKRTYDSTSKLSPAYVVQFNNIEAAIQEASRIDFPFMTNLQCINTDPVSFQKLGILDSKKNYTIQAMVLPWGTFTDSIFENNINKTSVTPRTTILPQRPQLEWKLPARIEWRDFSPQLCNTNMNISSWYNQSEQAPINITFVNTRSKKVHKELFVPAAWSLNLWKCKTFTINRELLDLDDKWRYTMEIYTDTHDVEKYFNTVIDVSQQVQVTSSYTSKWYWYTDYAIEWWSRKDNAIHFEVCSQWSAKPEAHTFNFFVVKKEDYPSKVSAYKPLYTTTALIDECLEYKIPYSDLPLSLWEWGNTELLLTYTLEQYVQEYSNDNNFMNFKMSPFIELTSTSTPEATPKDTLLEEEHIQPQYKYTKESVIEWMYEHELTKFNTLEEFWYDRLVTRGEITKFLWQYAVLLWMEKDMMKPCDFDDLTQYDQTLVPHIKNACQYWLIKGFEWKFIPEGNLTQAQWITVAMRSLIGIQNESIDPRWTEYVKESNERLITSPSKWLMSYDTPATRGSMWILLYKSFKFWEVNNQ